jgi:hypothetical protein
MARFSHYVPLAALALSACTVRDVNQPYQHALEQQSYIVDTVRAGTRLRDVLVRNNVSPTSIDGFAQLDFMPRIPENKIWAAVKRKPLQPSDSVPANTLVYLLRTPEYASR